MKLTAEIPHDKLHTLVARALKVELGALTICASDLGIVDTED